MSWSPSWSWSSSVIPYDIPEQPPGDTNTRSALEGSFSSSLRTCCAALGVNVNTVYARLTMDVGPDKVKREGNYLFTIDWRGLWADIPDQHKNHHIIAGRSGHLFAYPNNKLRFIDQSYIEDMPEESKHWRPNSRRWSVEG